jgi:hypothetical protein
MFASLMERVPDMDLYRLKGTEFAIAGLALTTLKEETGKDGDELLEEFVAGRRSLPLFYVPK